MNERKGEFHRWIIDEWTKIDCPWVKRFKFYLNTNSNTHSCIRLWEHKCGKMFIIYDTRRSSKR